MFRASPPLSGKELQRLASLHVQALSGSILGGMGEATLQRYYAWVESSPEEELFLVERAQGILGAAVLSMSPSTLTSRFIRSAPVRFATEVARTGTLSSAFRAQVAAFARETLSHSEDSSSGPELMQIFVDPAHAGRSLGTFLLADAERALKARSAAEYRVRTLLENNDATLAFYRCRGFTEAGTRDFCGDRYVFLQKRLTTPSVSS